MNFSSAVSKFIGEFENRVMILGERIEKLRFADDIVLLSETESEFII